MSVGGQGNTRDGFATQLLMISEKYKGLSAPKSPPAYSKAWVSAGKRTHTIPFLPHIRWRFSRRDPFRTVASTQRKKALENGLLRNVSK